MTMDKPIVNGYGNTITARHTFFTRQFLDRTTSQPVYVLYLIRKSFIIINDEHWEILTYVEKIVWECVSYLLLFS